MDTERTLCVTNLSCIRQHKTLFANLCFQVHAGETLLVQGPNGAGKSSLLRLLTGLATPLAGDILWQGKSIQTNEAEFADALHYVGHQNGIKLGLTVLENLQLAGQLALRPLQAANITAVLSLLELHAHQSIQAHFLSAGQKRRLALAKLFLFPKALWILDEPLTALDTKTQAFLLTQLEAHLQHGGIAVISSHHPIHIKPASLRTLRLASC